MRFPGMLRHGKIWLVLSSSAPFRRRGDARPRLLETAHGAYDSGLRAAEEAIAALTSVASLNATKSGSSGSS
jgi:hypothetical protein